jgi:hypothetical protein
MRIFAFSTFTEYKAAPNPTTPLAVVAIMIRAAMTRASVLRERSTINLKVRAAPPARPRSYADVNQRAAHIN